MQNITDLQLLRGARADGSAPPYNGMEFVPAKEALGWQTPIDAARAARVSEAQNRRFFGGILTNEQADALADAKPGSAAKAAKYYAEAGMGPVVWAEYGSIGGLTAFFPLLRATDYNHPAAPRTMPYRAEYGNPLVINPGVMLATMSYDLESEGVEGLSGPIRFRDIDPAILDD